MSEDLTAQRWRRRKDARPQEILDAALKVFAERGYAATRMEDIARRAGVTKGTIYLYFESKEAVFKALLAESVGQKIAELGAVARAFDGKTAELLASMLRIIGDFVCNSDRVALPKILIAEVGNFPELARYYREHVVDRGLALWTEILDRGVARGEFRPLAGDHVARLCIAPILLAAIWRTVFGPADPEPYDYNGLIETHIDVLLKGLAAEGGAAP
jgi:AcrR family transcriptional regulator